MPEYTDHFGLPKPDFDQTAWHDEFHAAMDIVDIMLYNLGGMSNVQGVWANAYSYATGNRVLDDDDGTLWQATAGHTSAATGSFAADRAGAAAGKWTLLSPSMASRGEWEPDTEYNYGDIATDTAENMIGIASATHTSTTSMRVDVANWFVVADLKDVADLADALADAQAAQAAAEAAQAAAETAATTAGAAKDLARLWAVEDEDVVVLGGEYSAYHWAQKAEDLVIAAADVNSVFGRTGTIVAATSDYDANQVDYDNGTSGLTATNVQAAIDEVEALISAIEGVTYASVAQIRAGVADLPFKIVDWTAALAPVALTDGATVTIDFSTGLNFTLSLGGNRTLAASNYAGLVGRSGRIRVVENGGTRTLNITASPFKTINAVDFVLGSGSGDIHVIHYEILSATEILLHVGREIG